MSEVGVDRTEGARERRPFSFVGIDSAMFEPSVAEQTITEHADVLAAEYEELEVAPRIMEVLRLQRQADALLLKSLPSDPPMHWTYIHTLSLTVRERFDELRPVISADRTQAQFIRDTKRWIGRFSTAFHAGHRIAKRHFNAIRGLHLLTAFLESARRMRHPENIQKYAELLARRYVASTATLRTTRPGTMALGYTRDAIRGAFEEVEMLKCAGTMEFAVLREAIEAANRSADKGDFVSAIRFWHKAETLLRLLTDKHSHGFVALEGGAEAWGSFSALLTRLEEEVGKNAFRAMKLCLDRNPSLTFKIHGVHQGDSMRSSHVQAKGLANDGDLERARFPNDCDVMLNLQQLKLEPVALSRILRNRQSVLRAEVPRIMNLAFPRKTRLEREEMAAAFLQMLSVELTI